MKEAAPSIELTQALTTAEGLSLWIADGFPSSSTVSKSRRLALASFSIAKAHYDGMLMLLATNAKTPASALVRPMLEATLRGYWFRHCATPEHLSFADERKVFPGIERMTAALARIPNGTVLRDFKDVPWGALSDFTHGGFRQIVNWIRGGTIQEAHADSTILDLLGAANNIVLIAAMGASELAGHKPDIFAAKLQEIADEHEFFRMNSEIVEMNDEIDNLFRELDTCYAELDLIKRDSALETK